MTTATAELTGEYTIDTAHSRVGFVARHAMVTKVRGAFDEWQGTAHIDGENPDKSWARVTIQAKSIDTRNSQRDEHLRSNDFLAMDDHPEITFYSLSVEVTGDSTYRMTGNLTIGAVTKAIAVDFTYTGTAVDPFGNRRVGLEGTAVINRRDFGITWNAVLEGGGLLVSEKIALEIEVSAIKNA
ncbi:YceI family protein [Kribbella sp. NPDC050124]|uniref:YceI family protein n=1 Tax=Kribbella sp. NPDC050124 TaxID=3364114 RepID=UPI0037BB70D0